MTNSLRPFKWTQPRLATLTAMWSQGEQASVIAALLGCSRNMVIGKAWRLGIQHGQSHPNIPFRDRCETMLDLIINENITPKVAAVRAGVHWKTGKQLWSRLCEDMGEMECESA